MTEKKQKTWLDIIRVVEPQFKEIAKTHNAVTWREECEFAHQIVTKNDGLAKSDIVTVQESIKNVASIGLTLNPAHGYAYLVPEYNKAKKCNDCQLRISFKGLIKLATDSGSVKWVKAEIVHAGDTFQFTGHGSLPKHEFNPFVDRGDMVGVYCVAKTHDGDYLTEMMAMDEVLKIKSAAKTQLVWDKWFEEMAKKAVIKRASKQWPKTDQFERMSEGVSLLNEYEGSAEYTDDQFDKFHHYLREGTDIEFFGYVSQLEEVAYNALYNSFEKGTKTKSAREGGEKEQSGLKRLQGIKADMLSDDDEIKETALDGLTDLEKRIALKYAQVEE